MTVYVLFEVSIAEGMQDEYLKRAASLKGALGRAAGFIRSERFESLAAPGKLLSLSVWESEDAVARWRNEELHRRCQAAGRDGVFEDYAITVLSPVRRAYGMGDRAQAPADSVARFGSEEGARAFGPRHHALLYAYLVRAFEEVAPDSFEAFSTEVTKAYARSRAERMRARALEDGLALDAKTYQSYSEVPAPLDGSAKTMRDAPEGVSVVTTACPWHTAWKEDGLLEYGALFCASFDAELARAFGPDVNMRVPCTLTQGSDCCSFVFEGARFDECDLREIAERTERLAGSATRPFDFHAAHLLHVFKMELARAYGEAMSDAVVEAGLRAFAAAFGMRDCSHLVSMEAESCWERR